MTLRKNKKLIHSLRGKKSGVVGLTLRQRKFIDEFMIDSNSSAAARRAGYADSSCKDPGNRLKNNPTIRAEIERREFERAERVDVKTDDILRTLKNAAYFDVRSLFCPVTKKFRTDPWSMDEDQLRALTNFEIIVVSPDGQYIVKAQPGNKLRALELLGKYKGMFSDRVERTGTQKVTFSNDFGENDPAPEKPVPM